MRRFLDVFKASIHQRAIFRVLTSQLPETLSRILVLRRHCRFIATKEAGGLLGFILIAFNTNHVRISPPIPQPSSFDNKTSLLLFIEVLNYDLLPIGNESYRLVEIPIDHTSLICKKR